MIREERHDQAGIAAAQAIFAGQPFSAGFVTPSLACLLAAARLHNGVRPQVAFQGHAATYAEHSGLLHALDGRYADMERPRGGAQGRTWSHLTTLYRHEEIERCNETIIDVLFAQLETCLPRPVLDAIAKVVGELHDNVASHASGRGFSAAQHYQPGHAAGRLEFAVADMGCGFLKNVQLKERTIATHADAIRWCLQKGNTATRTASTERTAEDDWADPDAEIQDRSGQRDHHMGLGLWLLSELVRATRGTMWIWTGDASCRVGLDGVVHMTQTAQVWSGVVIQVTLYPDHAKRVDLNPLTDTITSLAEELGL